MPGIKPESTYAYIYSSLLEDTLVLRPRLQIGGGIILPDTIVDEQITLYTVIAIGEQVEKIKVGDTVIFKEQYPVGLQFDGYKETFLQIMEQQIIGVYNG